VIDRIGSVKTEAKSLADLNEMAMGPAPDFGVRSNGTRINRVMPSSNADKIGLKDGDVLVRLNDETVRAGTDVQDALEDVEPGAHIELLVARNNLPVEISGTYEPALVTGPPRTVFAPARRLGPGPAANVVRAGRTLGPRRPGAHRQRRRGLDARRHRVHAAAVAGSVRLREAGEGDFQWANRLRRPRAERRPDADEVGRHRPRSDD